MEDFIFHLQKDLAFVFASRLDQVLNAAFDGGFPMLTKEQPNMASKL